MRSGAAIMRILKGLLLVSSVIASHAANPRLAPVCGTWQDEYITLHNQIISGKAPQRYAVAVSTPSGFADRLVGTISVFYFALLTGRAFQVSEGLNTHIKPLEWVYAQPSINWTEVQDYAAYVQHDKDSSADGDAGGQEEGEGEQLRKELEPMPQTYKFLDLLNKGPGDGIVQYTPWLQATSAESLDMDEDIVLAMSNRGTTFTLFKNPYIESRLAQMGLREDNVFGCAMDFLFKPLPEVEATVEREMAVLSQAMSQAPTPLPPCPRGDHSLAWDRSGKLLLAGHELSPHHAEHHHGGRKLAIGIHVRLGDGSETSGLKNEAEAAHADAAPYFKCAQQIEDEQRCGNQDVIWYVISDSKHVRQQAAELYGKKVLTALEATIQHSSNGEGRAPATALSMDGLHTAVGEHHAFGMTDFQVIGTGSGFGKTAAARSLRTKFSLYTVGASETCTARGHTTLQHAGENWSGL